LRSDHISRVFHSCQIRHQTLINGFRLNRAEFGTILDGMNPVYVPATGIDDWRRLLAQPDKHWRENYSAMCIAKAWQEATGFPGPVAAVLKGAGDPLASLEPLLIIPEHKVPLPGGRRESQNDVWVLAQHSRGLASITVEGKVSESLGSTLDEWHKSSSDGKRERLDSLTRTLGLAGELPGKIRYQLLHRAASAIIEAQRFRANIALMVIESFSAEDVGLTDFQVFTQLFGVKSEPDRIVELGEPNRIQFYAGWVRHPVDASNAAQVPMSPDT
jgi:hypothetical protein